MSEAGPGVRGVIVGHGALAEGLIDAVRSITGLPEDALRGISNAGKSPDALASEVEDSLAGGPCIVFTDMQVGSCAFTARRCCRQRRDVAVITGVNLPMLIDFAMHRSLPVPELSRRLLEHGRDAITAADFDPTRNAHRSASGR